MATQGSEARYAHLLEPIRDLAQNWSIDIASELEEYLGELESITISFDDGRTLNFAEAALLIQGSTCIYSKKVEHLYTLVYQVLNQVVEQKRNAKQATSLDESGTDADVAELTAHDEDEWLTLDDTLQEVDNISLAPHHGISDTSAFTLTRAPFLGSSSASGGGITSESELKMQSCTVHASGALLLPNFYLPPHVIASLSPGDLRELASDVPFRESASAGEDVRMGEVESDDDTWQPAGYGAGDTWTDGPAGDASDGHMPAAVWSPARDNGTAERIATEQAAGKAVSTVASAEETVVGSETCAASQSPTSVIWDPWAPLDPHEATPGLIKPFKKGRTHSSAEASAASAAIEASWLAEQNSEAQAVDAEKENDASGAGRRSGQGSGKDADEVDLLAWLRLLPPGATPGIVPLKQTLWEQFDQLHAAEAKRRAGVRRQRRLALAQRSHLSTHAEAAEAEAEADALRAGADYAVGGGDTKDQTVGESVGDVPQMDDDDVEPLGFDDDYDDLPDAGDGYALSTLLTGERPEEGGAPPSYEEICRAHVESCLQAGSSYAEDVELIRRVREWQVREASCSPMYPCTAHAHACSWHRSQSHQLVAMSSGSHPTVQTLLSRLIICAESPHLGTHRARPS